jgi:hypothetical protein
MTFALVAAGGVLLVLWGVSTLETQKRRRRW